MSESYKELKLTKPVEGEEISNGALAYITERNRNMAHGFVLKSLRDSDISHAELSRRMGISLEAINRMLGAPGDWTMNTVATLIFAIDGCEVKWEKFSFLDEPKSINSRLDGVVKSKQKNRKTRLGGMFRMAAYGAVFMYLGAGLFSGLLVQRAIPALNVIGISYIAATWPATIYCARTTTPCDPYPSLKTASYMFTFSE